MTGPFQADEKTIRVFENDLCTKLDDQHRSSQDKLQNDSPIPPTYHDQNNKMTGVLVKP